MKADKFLGTLTAKFAALALAFGCASGAWGSENFYQDSGDANLWHIANLDGLKEFRDNLNTGGTDYSGKIVKMAENLDIDLASEGSWTPIGNHDKVFHGTFDGNGVTFRNLTINDSTLDYAGLFGFMTSGALKNINIVNVSISAKDNVGAIAGGAQASTAITNCHVSGTINISGNHYVGGISGWCYANTCNCSVDGGNAASSVLHAADLAANSGDGDDVGGILGFAGEAENEIIGCSVRNVTIEGFRQVGGVIGLAQSGRRVINCSATDVVVKCIADAYTAAEKTKRVAFGGIVGVFYSKGAITNCTATRVSMESTDAALSVARMGFITGGKYNSDTFTMTDDMGVSYAELSAVDCTRVCGTLQPTAAHPLIDGPVSVAQIGATPYPTLKAAFDAAASGDTVTLLADVTDDTLGAKGIVIDGSRTITLDLAGHGITCTDGSAANNRMIKLTGTTTLNVTNSSATVGVMDVLGSNSPVANTSTSTTLPYGVFRAEAGTTLNVTATDGNIQLKNGRAWGLNVKLCGAAATLTGVTINSQYGGGIEVTEANLGTGSVTGSATLTGCTFTQAGYFDHCSTPLSVSGGSALTVDGGAYSGEQVLYVFSSGGFITVNDGTFTGNGGRAAFVASIDTGTYPSYTGGMVLKGGQFTGTFSITSPAYVSATGGTYSIDPSAYVADGYAAVQDGAVWKVGEVTAGAMEKQDVTDTTATYSVPVTVTDSDGNTLATLTTATVAVGIGAGDVAGTTLDAIDLDKVVADIVEAKEGDVTKIDIQISAEVKSTAAQSVTYEVHPEAVVTAGGTTTTETLSNDDLAANASFTFDLDVTATGVAAGGWVKVTHVSAGYPADEKMYKAKAGGGGVVVTVTTTHFSTFTATPGDPEGTDASLLPSVTNSVASANLFGALTVGGTAKPAYVAVPFGAFGDGDAAIAAADVVQAAALSDGDKMYVWNGAEGGQQKYEVYTVSGGAWTVAKKVTVAADGTQTEGSDFSPDAFPVASGKGVFIERADTSKPLYVYGQVLTNAVAETTFEAGLTLVSAPSTKAMGEIDLNALAWSGVTELPTRTARGKDYPDWSKIGEADYIYFRNAAGSTVKCYYSGGKWVAESGSAVVKVPAGTAFWYSGKAAGAKVKW